MSMTVKLTIYRLQLFSVEKQHSNKKNAAFHRNPGGQESRKAQVSKSYHGAKGGQCLSNSVNELISLPYHTQQEQHNQTRKTISNNLKKKMKGNKNIDQSIRPSQSKRKASTESTNDLTLSELSGRGTFFPPSVRLSPLASIPTAA